MKPKKLNCAIIIIAFLMIFSIGSLYAKPGQKLEYICQAVHVDLLSDGTMNSTTISSSINISEEPLYEYTFMSSIHTLKADEAFPVRILCRPEEKIEMQIKVNPTIELFSLIHHFAGDNQYNERLLPEYLEEVDRYFSPFKDHPAVNFAKKCSTQHLINGDAPMALAVTIGPPPALEPRIDLSSLPKDFDPRWDLTLIKDYLKHARSFAIDSRFMEFHNNHNHFHDQAVANLKEMLTKEHFFQWYHDFFGYHPDNFSLYIGLLNGSCNYGYSLTLPEGRMESVSILGARRPDSNGAPTYPKSRFLPVIIHEFCHSYINPLTISQPVLLKELGESLLVSHRNQMTQMGYNVWNVILNEYMVRACTIRFLAQSEGQTKATQWMERDKKGGFLAIEGLVKLLEEYEKKRNKYPDIKSFLPQIKKYFESYLAGFRADLLLIAEKNKSF